jgi:hypothetical protein
MQHQETEIQVVEVVRVEMEMKVEDFQNSWEH